LAFARQHQTETDLKQQVLTLLQRMADSQTALIRSRQTQRFYQNIQRVCGGYLQEIDDNKNLLEVLGWSLRLMRYYRVEPKRAVEEQRRPRPRLPMPEPPRQPQPERRPEPRPQTPPPQTRETTTIGELMETKTKQQSDASKPRVRVGDRVTATIEQKQGHRITVTLQDFNEAVTFEHPYYPGRVGAKVKVKVLAIDLDGNVTKVAAG
jgi:hypothetical protein